MYKEEFMKRVTLKDIANELNVTVGAVSHALNGMNDISKETAKKIIDTAKKMGYIPNNSAISLRSGKTGTVAIIIPDISNPHLAYQIKLVEDKIKQEGYSVIIMNTNENSGEEYNAIVSACSKQVDGIMLCPSQHSTENISFLIKQNMPYILIGRYFKNCGFDYVCSDDIKGGYLAGRYLTEKNCKNPIYLGASKYIESSINRFEGLKKAFAEKNIHLCEKRFFEVNPTSSNLYEVYDDICAKKVSFDSIVTFSDLFAFKLLSKMKNIPFVSFDAVNTRLHIPCFLPSVGMTGNGWSEKAVSALLKKISGSHDKVNELIDVKLYM